jgi:hypothetical protein
MFSVYWFIATVYLDCSYKNKNIYGTIPRKKLFTHCV